MAIATRRLRAAGEPEGGPTQRQVMEAAVEAGDLSATIGAIARLTGAPAVLQNPFLAVVAGTGDPGIALNRSGGPLERDLLRAGSASRPSLLELPRHGTTPARLVARITARGDLLGYLTVGSVDAAAYATLEGAAPVVALLLQAEERLCRVLDRDQRELFLDLLAGRATESLVIQGRRLGHDLQRPHWPLAFVAGTGPPGTEGRLEALVAEALRNHRPAGDPAPVLGTDGDGVVVFLPDGHPDGPAGLARRVRCLAGGRGLPVVGGWGPRCDELASFGTGVARARWVVDVLGGLPGDPEPTGYDDLGIYALLYEKRDRDRLGDFADRWLGPLADHRELTHTLRVLLDTGGPSAAAAALYVHISTLKYRLRKIEAILGADLSDPEVCFNLRLAFKIDTVRRRLAGTDQAGCRP
ncbi:MAG TPA: helix-turn-helix domain-containing protein [Acidimicrobiia bacterium]|nr:helix-turn-helix domain-containing protein [Acidimicrobiia bacterium]